MIADELRRLQELLRQGTVAPSSQTIREMRDGVGLVLELSGVGREPLRYWPGGSTVETFLDEIPETVVSEETLIDHDVARLPGFIQALTRNVGWKVFEDPAGRHRVMVLNVNMEPLETTLGVDVIYYSELRESFVLVQYKRLTGRSVSDPEARSYRPDKNMERELARMREVDRVYGASPGPPFRLYPQPSWIKLCESRSLVDPTTLIPGMYLSVPHYDELVASVPRGPRGGLCLSYENIDRHITNTLFVELVRGGWIGTRTTDTEGLMELIKSVLASRRHVIIGADFSGGQVS